MPTDRPTATEILQAIETFLQEKVAPQVDRHTRFHLKVTANLLRLLQRERNQYDTLEQAELVRLQALLDDECNDLTTLNARLCDAIREGRFVAGDCNADETALLEHLRATTRAKLAIDNPACLRNRGHSEQPSEIKPHMK